VLTDRVNEIFEAEGEKGRKQSKLIATPPYVTARPDVSFRKIHRSGEKLKFVILATDGRKYHTTDTSMVAAMVDLIGVPADMQYGTESLPKKQSS
jgi:pyruvate dehydrogenase phosphatase